MREEEEDEEEEEGCSVSRRDECDTKTLAEVVSRFPPASKIFIHASISSRRSPRPSRRPPRLADGRGASTP